MTRPGLVFARDLRTLPLLPFVFVLFLSLADVTLGAEIESLGDLPGGTTESYGAAFSQNGLVVVGDGTSAAGTEAFRWTQAGGMAGLGDLPGGLFYSSATDVSADGSVVVGYSQSMAGTEAFRWTQAGGMVGLGDLPGGMFDSRAHGVSADGSVVVGGSISGSGGEAFRWTQAGGMVGLGDLPGGAFDSFAYGVTPDGSVIVGYGTSALGLEAMRWTQAGGMVGLGDLPGGIFNSEAYAVSTDGSVVVGSGVSDSGTEAFRWTQATGMAGLGDIAGGAFYSKALGVNSDGSVVVGYGTSATGDTAFRWTQASGMLSLKDYLVGQGVDLTGWTLNCASAVSGDGSIITGSAVTPSGNTEAFIAREGGLTTPTSQNQSLASLAPVGSTVTRMGMSSVGSMLDASRNALVSASTGLSGGDVSSTRRQFWVVGRILSDNSFAGDDLGGEGGTGLTWHLDNGLSLGAGVFTGKRALKTAYNGSQDVEMVGPAAFLAYAPEADGLRAELGAMWTYSDLDLKRGYANGAGTATSKGSTQALTTSLSGRLGWVFALDEQFAIQPFAQYTWQMVSIDGYSEHDGPFPASYSSREDFVNQTRLGAEFQYACTDNVDLWTWAAWSHRFEDKSSAMSGNLTGVGAFNYGGSKIDQDWADAGLGGKWRPWEGFETFSRLGFGIDSDDHAEPDLSLTIGLAWDI